MKVIANTDAPAEDHDALQEALKRRGEIPSHIAVIMDGNGRWARERGKRRAAGHRAGVDSAREVTEACARLGVKYLTLYTFSHENWDRPSAEVRALMSLLVRTIRRETGALDKNDIRLRAVGDLSMMPREVRRELREAMEETRGNDRMTLTIAVSYSGRLEIVRAARSMAERAARGALRPEDIDEELFASALMTSHMPDPDLLIRTGGEFRISNFLLWQLAYTELYITDRYWPAFRRHALYEAIRDYQDRERRFGRIGASD